MFDLSVTTTGSGQPGINSGREIVSQIARIVGGETESNVRVHALGVANRVRHELNQHDLRIMKRTQSITLVNGTQTYTLDTVFKKPSHAQLLDASSKPLQDLTYVDDAWQAHNNPTQASTGMPYYYWLRNDFNDGLVSVYPIPDSGASASYPTLRIEYFRRIPVITDDNTAINVPEEMIAVLVAGGQALLLRERKKESPVTPQAFSDYMRLLNLLVTSDRRMTDEKARFRVGIGQRQPTGTILIRT